MTWGNVLAAALLVAGAVYVTERLAPTADKPRVEVRTVYQDRILPGVPTTVYRTLTNYVTNATELSNLVSRMRTLDSYLTAPGWIAVSNERIHAGLVARAWSADYVVHMPDNVAGAVAGTMYGGLYMRRLGRVWVGAVAGVADGRGQASAVAAWAW